MKMQSKQCSRCKEVKELNYFNKSKQEKDGHQYYCKECAKSFIKKFKQENLELLRKWESTGNRKAYIKNKTKRNLYTKNYFKNRKDGLYYVYLLWEEFYCGQTDCPNTRVYGHNQDGRYSKDQDIVMSFRTRKEAKLMEAHFHALGWYGKAVKDPDYCLKIRKYIKT